MIRDRSAVMLALAILLSARVLGAQDAQPPPWRSGQHHGKQRPNYLAEITPQGGLATINLPPPPPGASPAVVKGLYVNAWIFGSSRFYDLVALADTTEVNAFVIDIKDGTGYITYRSSVPVAEAVGANAWARAPDVRKRLAVLREHGIYPIARIVVAKDTLLATHKPEWAVHSAGGGLWRDRFGGAWVDAYRDSVWIYAADLAAEAVLLGFREIQFDYVRFPDEKAELLEQAIFPAREPRESRRRGIRRNLTLAKERLEALGVPLTVDVFGLTTSALDDLGIGQNWEDLLSVVDVVLPMVYPSHYYKGAYGFSFPNAEPYGVVRRALEDGLRRAASVAGAAQVRPFLQSFSIRRVRYTAVEVRAQIAAVEDVGLTDWVLWNASGRYPAGAFRPSDSPYVDSATTVDRRPD